MIPALLLAFREGLEAALILGIALGVLQRIGQRGRSRAIWLGTVVGAVLSLAVGLGLYALGLSFEGQAEEIFEGLAMLLAAGVLTWMIFWMGRQGRSIQSSLERDIRRATSGNGWWALFALAFSAVLREGIELALFLTAAAFTASEGETLIGGLIGLVAAAGAGWLLFAGTRRLAVRTFFRVTGILLIFFAAGLVAHGIHELNEAGWIPAIIEHVWDTNSALDDNSGGGQILKALFGYNGNPSLTEVIGYGGYWLVVVLALWWRRTQVREHTPAPAH